MIAKMISAYYWESCVLVKEQSLFCKAHLLEISRCACTSDGMSEIRMRRTGIDFMKSLSGEDENQALPFSWCCVGSLHCEGAGVLAPGGDGIAFIESYRLEQTSETVESNL